MIKNRLIQTFSVILIVACSILLRNNLKSNYNIKRLQSQLKVLELNRTEIFIRQINIASTFKPIKLPLDVNKPKLIYVYTDKQCGKCIAEEVDIIRSTLDTCSVHIFPFLCNNRANNASIRSNLHDMPYSQINTKAIDFPKDGKNTVRFIGILTPSGNITNIFFPHLYSLKEKQLYIETVKNAYKFN